MLFGKAPVWVAGDEALVRRVVGRLYSIGRRARQVSLADLAGLKPGACRTLVLADPPAPADWVAILAERLGNQPVRGRRPVPLRLILVHQADPPPLIPELDPAGPILLETFALEDRAARVLLKRWPLHCGFDPVFGQRPHLLIVGFGRPARAVIVQALRMIPYGEGSRPRVTIADLVPAERTAFLQAYPHADQVADLVWTDLERLDLASAPPVTQAMVFPNPAADGAVTVARHLVRRLASAQGTSPPVLVEVGDEARGGRLTDWDGQTCPFSYLDEACRPSVLFDGLGDELAQTIHESYTDSIVVQGRDPEREPAGRPWSRLSVSYRNANRHQADHLWAKLAVMDCRAVQEEQVESFTFAPLEAESLAVIEHLRWAADRYLDGWSYAPVRDNARKHHPQLIPYEDLSEPMKDLDRFAVRGVPTLLARSGLGVERMLIVGVRAAVCPVDGRLQRLIEQALGRLLARYPDRSLVIASTLAEPASRLFAWHAMGRTGPGLFLLCPRPLAETLSAQPDDAARLDLLGLVTRAERRISLPGTGDGESELERWFAERAEIQLCLGPAPDLGGAGASASKRVVLDPAAGRIVWGFEY